MEIKKSSTAYETMGVYSGTMRVANRIDMCAINIYRAPYFSKTRVFVAYETVIRYDYTTVCKFKFSGDMNVRTATAIADQFHYHFDMGCSPMQAIAMVISDLDSVGVIVTENENGFYEMQSYDEDDNIDGCIIAGWL